MAHILPKTFSLGFECKVSYLYSGFAEFIPNDPVDKNSAALVQVMACHQTGGKPLPEPMLIQFIDAYPDSKVHGANIGPIWGRQDPGGFHVGPMNFVI